MAKIIKLWCSAHKPTADQGAGFTLLSEQGEAGAKLQARLNNCPDNGNDLVDLASDLIRFADSLCESSGDWVDLYQPGGSPAFQFGLGLLLRGGKYRSLHIEDVYYAHSERVSEDAPQPDGTVKKVSTFKHKSWVLV